MGPVNPQKPMRIVQATAGGSQTRQKGSATRRTVVVTEKTIHSCAQMTIGIDRELNRKTRSEHARSPDWWVSNQRFSDRLDAFPSACGSPMSAAQTNDEHSIPLPPNPTLLGLSVKSRTRERDAIRLVRESTWKR